MNRDLHKIPVFRNRLCGILSAMMVLVVSSCGQTGTGQQPTPDSGPVEQGILSFGTTNNSVVFRSSLTSAASITAAGGSQEAGSMNEFDAELGMKPRIAPGVTPATPGCRFTSSSIPALGNLPSGQLSIEVEREWLATTNVETRSVGSSHTENEYLLSYGPGDSSSAGMVYMQPNQSLLWFFKATEMLKGTHYVYTHRSERFARITLSWSPGEARLYVDGLLMATIDRTDQGADRFSTVYVGSLIGSALSSFPGNYYVRNLIVARVPVVLQTPPILEHVMQLGDSFSTGPALANLPAKYDAMIPNTVIGQLARHGIGYGKYTVYSHGGGNIQDNGPRPIEASVNGYGRTRAQALTENPTLVIFVTGGNDAGIFNEIQFTTDLQDHIEAFLGEHGHPATTVRHVIITTTASNLAATSPVILSMVRIMKSVPAWWDSTYPLRAGSVSVIDTWSIFGGENVDRLLFGITDTVHPSASGDIVYGRAIAEKILALKGVNAVK